MDASPVKRRVLGALDPNACSSPKIRHDGKLLAGHSPVKAKAVAPRHTMTVTSPTRVLSRTPEMAADSRKRRSPTPPTEPRVDETETNEPVPKRPCLNNTREDAQPRRPESPPSSASTSRTSATSRHRSASPDTSSMFDTSAVDNSQATILTEPDAAGPAPARAAAAPLPAPPLRTRPRLTREQAREKAEILRLRLGLASYKVRTGQTDLPLDRLEARPIGLQRSLARAVSFSDSQKQGDSHQGSGGPTSVSSSFPPPPTGGGASRGNRRPLPGAPARRGSSGVVNASAELGEIARAMAPMRQMLEALGQRRQQQQQQQHSLPPPPQQQQPHQHHQRRQSEVQAASYDWRRYSEAVVPPRPRTATDVVESSSSWGRNLVMADGEEDMESRGGAASGLLSLARS